VNTTRFGIKIPPEVRAHFYLVLFTVILTGFGAPSGDRWSIAREMKNEASRVVQIPDSPQRIVSLAPSITECLFALGAGEQIVGVTRFSNYPPEAASRPKVGSYIQINLERVLSLKPDLVLATKDGNPRAAVERLVEMGLAVYAVDPRNMEGLFHTLQTLGVILHRQAAAEALVRGLKQRLERIQGTLVGRARPRVLLQIGMDPLVTVGRGTLQDQLIDLAGGENIAAKDPISYPTVSTERVLEAKPEVILVSSMAGRRDPAMELQRWRRWPALPAVAQGRIYAIDGDLIDRPSPRILDGLEEMVVAIHPEVAPYIRGPN
jgi:iron complex transport system substrate-binding protein